jgi:hypothetical protein
MTNKLTVIFMGVAVFGTASPIFAGEINKRVEKTNTERVNFAPGGTINFKDSNGSLIVEGWDQPVVEITVSKSLPYDYQPKQKDEAARLERLQVKTEHPSPTELTISTILPPHHHFPLFSSATGNVTLDYQVYVPRNSKLVIHHGDGYVMVSNVNGEIEATCGRGDIMLMLPDPGPYAIDAKSKLGTVLSDFAGDAHVQHLVGERYASESPAKATRIYLRMGFGGITVKELPSRP